MKLVIAALLLAACGGKSAPATTQASAPSPTCEAVADHVKQLANGKSDKVQATRDAILARCVGDGWAADVRVCIASTESLDDPRHCKAMLTTPQRTTLEAALDAIEHPAYKVGVDIPPQCTAFASAVHAMRSCTTLDPWIAQVIQDQVVDMGNTWGTLREHDRDLVEAFAQDCEHQLGALTAQLAKAGC